MCVCVYICRCVYICTYIYMINLQKLANATAGADKFEICRAGQQVGNSGRS